MLTTAAVLEMSKGNFGTALALGLILLFIVLVIAVVLAGALHRMRRL